MKIDGLHSAREPIAIVGLGCRLPGASSVAEFWDLLSEGRSAIREIPRDRFDLDALFCETPATPGHIMTRWAGVLDRLQEFDAQFFGIAPREAELVDPQQRLLLEVSWEALEDAGIPADALNNSNTGVFVGLWLNEYESRMFRDPAAIDFYKTLGTGRYSASGRLSYFYGLQGPSITVDTACSSSLVAVHLACKSLWSGECATALAGGANTILEPFITIAYSQSKMMAPDGRCKFGDAAGDGYVRSDGAGVVVLKRLSDAEASGDPIYAVIRGGATNNDGRGSGFLATPAQDGQMDLLRKAYRDAGVPPGLAQYVEAHGTGTLAGDPVEIQALGEVLREGRPKSSVCRLGSVKTNIGHTESAAGVVGLMKVALALKYGTIPPSLHFTTPNPRIPWDSLPVRIQAEASEWPEGRDGAVAGVSAFGIAGTNAHVVLQAYAAPAPAREADGDRPRVLPIAAHSPDALVELARAWSAWLRTADEAPFADACYTAAVRRTQQDHRVAVVARGRLDAAEALDAFVAGEARPNVVSGCAGPRVHNVVFVFPGQGSQWLGTGRGLLEREPVFAGALAQCDAAVRAITGWSVIEELRTDAAASRLEQIDVVQPVLFSIQVALAALWRSWGIEPVAVVGHSMGEVAAAHVAGALSLEDAARVICARSTLMKRTSGKGGMAVVELSFDDARAALAGQEHLLSIAVSNSPRSTVIAGDTHALDSLLATLDARDVFCRRIKVDVASHSPQMDPLRADLLASLQGLSPRQGSCAFHSTAAAKLLQGEELNDAYWVRNLREPVRFSTVVQGLIAKGHDTFIEMSSHPLLVGAMQEMLRDADVDGIALASTRREEDEQSIMLASLAALHVSGVPVPWQRHFAAGARVTPAPTYRWQREVYWYDAPAQPGRRSRPNDLLGEAFRPALADEPWCWEFEVSADALPSLVDHRVRGAVVVPAAMLAELILEAAGRVFGKGSHPIERFSIGTALVLRDASAETVQVVMSNAGHGAASFKILSRPAAEQEGSTWTEHATGAVRRAPAAAVAATLQVPVGDLRDRGEHIDADEFYERMRARSLDYGPAYRRVAEAWRSDSSFLTRVTVPEGARGGKAAEIESGAALIDACLQGVLATAPGGDVGGRADAYLPTRIERLTVHARPERGTDLFCLTAAQPAGDTLTGDVTLVDAAGRVLIEAGGVRMTRIERAEDTILRSAFYRVEWTPAPRPEAAARDAGRWVVVGRQEESQILADRLQSRGARVAITGPSDLPAAIAQGGVRGVACVAAGLGAADSPDALAEALEVAKVLARCDATDAPRLWFVTTGTHSVAETGPAESSLAGAGIWGLGATIAAEHPRLRCTAIDVGTFTTDVAPLVEELLADGTDDQVALRGTSRFVRMLRAGLPEPSSAVVATTRAAGRPFRVTTSAPGIIDALGAELIFRRPPAAHEVEIEVEAAGLNFMNIMSAMGTYPGYDRGLGPLGIECAGRIVRVGTGVTEFAPGDRVAAFAHDSLASHTTTDARLVVRIGSHLSFERAATLPIAFLTAYYALHHLGRVRAGERVLIHSATGGVGLAAIQLARAAGAEIYATAGTEEKRTLLRSLGVACVADSRSTAFADAIQVATRGEGVDLVLNSLAGAAADAGVSLLRNGGRFVEIGKRDIYDNRSLALWPFHRNLSYFAVDLDKMAREHADALGPIFRDCMAHVEAAGLEPLPFQVFDVAHVSDAFRLMAQGAHTGKIVIAIDRDGSPVRPRATALPADWTRGAVLITGGTGGLGLEIADWLVAQGANDLVLVSRRGEGEAARARLDACRARGARVTVLRADVSDASDVKAVLASVAGRGQTILGIIHAAGLLDDATLLEIDERRLQSVLAPKVLGAWNLHRLTADQPLDFFVLFSSVASFIGLPGQGNYAAANAWLDALAAVRRASGMPATSVSWGPWSEVGLAAESENRGERLSGRGLRSIPPAVGLAALGRILDANPVHAAVMSFEFDAWASAYPSARNAPFFAAFAPVASSAARSSATSLREDLLALPAGRSRRVHMEAYLQQQVAQVLKLTASRIDVTKPLRTMGLDSLMALELRNRLESAAKVSVPATMIWNYPTIGQLAPQVAARMGIALEEAGAATSGGAVASAVPGAGVDALLQEIEGMSDEDVRRMLAEEA